MKHLATFEGEVSLATCHGTVYIATEQGVYSLNGEELKMTDGSGHIGEAKDAQGNIVDIGDKWSKKWKPPRFGYTMLAEMNLTQTQIWSSEDATSIIVRLVDGTELEYLVRGYEDAG